MLQPITAALFAAVNARSSAPESLVNARTRRETRNELACDCPAFVVVVHHFDDVGAITERQCVTSCVNCHARLTVMRDDDGDGGDERGTVRERRHASDDDRAYEDYSCKSPYERLVYDVEDVLGRWLDATATNDDDDEEDKWVHAFTHGLHWRREPYVCALTRTREEEEEGDAKATLREWLKTSSSSASTSVAYATSKSSGDVYDFCTLFGVSCVLMIRPASATGRFFDQDESLTVRSAFTLAMSTLGVGGHMAVITPRGEYDREFSGDVSDDVNGDAVLETDVTRFTRFSTAEEIAERTYVGCVNRYLKQVRNARESADATGHEVRDIDNSLVSARITLSLNSSTSSGRDEFDNADADASEDDSDIEDMRVRLGDQKRKNVHEDLDSSEFGLFLDEWDDDAPWSPWVNMEDPWRSLALDAVWPSERLETMYAFSELNIDDAPKWFLRGDLTQAARDRGEEDDELLSRDTSTLSEMLYELVQSAAFVATAAGLDTATLAGMDYWHRNNMDAPSLPSEHVLRGAIRGIFDVSTQTHSAEAKKGELREPSKSAPRDTLLTRLALHACLLKNARAVAHLWNAFTHELRYTYWERGREIPAVVFDPTFGIDHGACVLNQKLQMLNQCILRRNARSSSDLQQSAVYVEKQQSQINAEWDSAGGGWSGDELDELATLDARENAAGWGLDADLDLSALLNDESSILPSLTSKPMTRSTSENRAGKLDDDDEYASADEELTDADACVDDGATVSPSNDTDDMDDDDTDDEANDEGIEPEGVREILTLRLSKPPHAFMRAPFTQDAPMYTEDALAEREASMRALGDDDEGRAARQRMQSIELCSDMSAFKASNPGAKFQDFVRWHSPKDWTPDAATVSTDEFAPRGRLSARMRHKGNTWIELWRNTPRCAASKQALIFDPVVEGERALHHLETVAAAALFAQLTRCACAAILGIYASTDAYTTRANATTVDAVKIATDTCSALFTRGEDHDALTVEDYERAVFAVQLAERATARAESLHKKFPDAPPALLDALLIAASKWDTEREINTTRAAHRVLTSECHSEDARSALRASRPSRSARCAEYLIRAPIHGSMPHHRLHVLVTDAHTRVSRRTSAM